MSENDPWKAVAARPIHDFIDCGDDETTLVFRMDDVKAARAAEATQHQQEIAAKDETIDGLRLVALGWEKQRDAARARLAAVEAKLDALRVHCEHCGADYAATGMEAGCPCAVRAERDRLKAALSTAAFALDLAGFRRDRDAAYAALTPQGQSTDGETR